MNHDIICITYFKSVKRALANFLSTQFKHRCFFSTLTELHFFSLVVSIFWFDRFQLTEFDVSQSFVGCRRDTDRRTRRVREEISAAVRRQQGQVYTQRARVPRPKSSACFVTGLPNGRE